MSTKKYFPPPPRQRSKATLVLQSQHITITISKTVPIYNIILFRIIYSFDYLPTSVNRLHVPMTYQNITTTQGVLNNSDY